MYALLVLGEIPGTDIQINFTAWLIALAVLIGIYIVRVLLRTKSFSLIRAVSQTADDTINQPIQTAE